jgi:hypothetical protein
MLSWDPIYYINVKEMPIDMHMDVYDVRKQ